MSGDTVVGGELDDGGFGDIEIIREAMFPGVDALRDDDFSSLATSLVSSESDVATFELASNYAASRVEDPTTLVFTKAQLGKIAASDLDPRRAGEPGKGTPSEQRLDWALDTFESVLENNEHLRADLAGFLYDTIMPLSAASVSPHNQFSYQSERLIGLHTKLLTELAAAGSGVGVYQEADELLGVLLRVEMANMDETGKLNRHPNRAQVERIALDAIDPDDKDAMWKYLNLAGINDDPQQRARIYAMAIDSARHSSREQRPVATRRKEERKFFRKREVVVVDGGFTSDFEIAKSQVFRVVEAEIVHLLAEGDEHLGWINSALSLCDSKAEYEEVAKRLQARIVEHAFEKRNGGVSVDYNVRWLADANKALANFGKVVPARYVDEARSRIQARVQTGKPQALPA